MFNLPPAYYPSCRVFTQTLVRVMDYRGLWEQLPDLSRDVVISYFEAIDDGYLASNPYHNSTCVPTYLFVMSAHRPLQPHHNHHNLWDLMHLFLQPRSECGVGHPTPSMGGRRSQVALPRTSIRSSHCRSHSRLQAPVRQIVTRQDSCAQSVPTPSPTLPRIPFYL